jgi:hypothetical protein
MKDLDQQFVCKDCAQFGKCKYYHNRQEDSQICKYFHLFPDNATNGDVIKAMFPNDSIDFLIVNMDRRDWLNTPYRRETE